VLRHYEERLSLMARRLHEYLHEAGVDDEKSGELMEMYMLSKELFSSVRVDATYESLDMRIGPIQIVHVPGHCPGQVVLRVGEILFSGDHILETTTPHQAPEQLGAYTGLGHYLDSLGELLPWCGQIRLTLGGHEKPIYNLCDRILEIRGMHAGRLTAVLDLLKAPKTILQVAEALFGQLDGYEELLAIEEAGAHVEYLLQRAQVRIENWRALEGDPGAPMRYVRCDAPPLAGELIPAWRGYAGRGRA
jgi:glyoxylase-like metal-dependent hydrolase (beta-lactamase superfamily II)